VDGVHDNRNNGLDALLGVTYLGKLALNGAMRWCRSTA